jgi:hypothetical protein
MELLGLAQKERNNQFAKNEFMISLLDRNSSLRFGAHCEPRAPT